jgi:hypothetical protein
MAEALISGPRRRHPIPEANSMSSRLHGPAGGFVLVFGAVIPLVAVLVEVTTHICAETFFDPLPTPFHVALVVFVPLANFQIWRALRNDDARHVRIFSFANGVVIGIATFYTLLYLPLTPFALIALMILVGVLPLTPITALISALICRRHLRRMALDHGVTRLPSLVPAILVVIVALALPDAHEAFTRYHMRTAVHGATSERAEAVGWLRSYGDTDVLLRSCYIREAGAGSLTKLLFSFGNTVDTEQARELYYRATGVPFTSVLPPVRRARSIDFDLDEEQGGPDVAGRVKGLSLASSRIDGSVDPEAALGYVEWTLVFKNVSAFQREARAQVALPPGGVVSRLTLWINGEEREATFAARAAVRRAYEGVVRQRRDPVLVTTSGPDQVLVQCFPVPPNGGEMKVRLGITSPIELESRERGLLSLPRILERNFSVEDLKHAVWVESKGPLEGTGGALRAEAPARDLFAVRGDVADSDFAGAVSVIVVTRPAGLVETVANDPAGGVIHQTVTEGAAAPPSRVVLVVDGSVSMAARAEEVADALDALPDGLDVGVVLAGDQPEVIADLQPGSAALASRVAERLRSADYVGGRDNALALAVGWDIAAAAADGAVVWVHGPQPVSSHEVDGLRNRFERRPDGPLLFDLPAVDGPNRVAEGLGELGRTRSVAHVGTVEQNLERLFRSWHSGASVYRLVRDRVPPQQKAARVEATGSGHLARLWAYDQVTRLLTGREKDSVETATKLAAEYRLVTPVTGAVVLETEQQYRAAGLEPGSAEGVPTIPEPEVWLLVCVAAIALAWVFLRRRSSCEPV